MPSIRELAVSLFREHGLAVELISLQLLFALVGALYLGKQQQSSLTRHAAHPLPQGEVVEAGEGAMIVPLEHILILAGLLFFIGMGGLLAWRANLIMMLVCIEVMLNAVMLVFVAGSARWGNADGQLFAIFIMALTSAEVSLALAMVVYLHRRRKTVDTDVFSEMKG